MVISIGDYKAKYPTRKIVNIDNGVEFEIRVITPLDIWTEKGIDRNNPSEFIRTVVVKGIVSPPVSIEEQEGFLCINEIKMEHQNKLVDEILIFSGYKSEDGKAKDFLSADTTPSTLTE